MSCFGSYLRHFCIAVALVAATGGCTPRGRAAAPHIAQAHPRSELGPELQRLIDAMRAEDPGPLATWMTPALRRRLDLDQLANAATRLRKRFGLPLGILEERAHHEGQLRWVSALVLYGTSDRKPQLTPVLYQFALTPDGALDRLLVREHWFLDRLSPPAEHYVPITRLHFPAKGAWTVLQGGRTLETNYHHGNLHQRYAYDLVVKRNGRQRPAGSNKHNNASYYTHGQDLLAPAAGIVNRIVDGVPENRPPESGRAGGNGLTIDHGFGEYSALWHMIPGSIQVKVGDRVHAGQVLGKVGNSGRSTGAHIHYHLSYRPDGIQEIFGLPAPFVDSFINNVWQQQRVPIRGETIRRAAPTDPSTPKLARGQPGPGPDILFDQ